MKSRRVADATGTQASPPATPWLPRRQTSRSSDRQRFFRASHSCRRERLRSSRIRELSDATRRTLLSRRRSLRRINLPKKDSNFGHVESETSHND